ncbi:WLM-domain-containing protein [Tilletiaria anomala UBC 951]|uniref:WLM-domain-containing protein n=1 Tax=Tilletiaria anomala (strain ATCC 24038 / CBS 436.72 / UBC 951) TaxID=1037660 RepID=A0A066VZL6_TILAU|nr:WLM-domain-containing protein [Tilletiaria anomala UBC 951]KDN43975.1 WLM-domain-containing protein [Tilletiaria anomala UBC 951]
MVHLRLNDPDTSRNPHINFVHAFPDLPDSAEAQQRLLQVAALFRPVMKDLHLTVNSLVEYEYNREFAGRNWNAGESIELVLRKPNGGWFSLRTVAFVMSHELAHIRHMNHLRPHTELAREIQAKVEALILKGYFGDGFWSSGYRLSDGELHTDETAVSQELSRAATTSLCGGARQGVWKGRSNSKKRSSSIRNTAAAEDEPPKAGPSGNSRPGRGFKGPSLRTGPQTPKNTEQTFSKRLRRALPGAGRRVDDAKASPHDSSTAYPTKYKRTQSQMARNERLQAVERRMAGSTLTSTARSFQGLQDQDPNAPSCTNAGATSSTSSEAPAQEFSKTKLEPKDECFTLQPGLIGPLSLGPSSGGFARNSAAHKPIARKVEVIRLVDSSDDEAQ